LDAQTDAADRTADATKPQGSPLAAWRNSCMSAGGPFFSGPFVGGGRWRPV